MISFFDFVIHLVHCIMAYHQVVAFMSQDSPLGSTCCYAASGHDTILTLLHYFRRGGIIWIMHLQYICASFSDHPEIKKISWKKSWCLVHKIRSCYKVKVMYSFCRVYNWEQFLYISSLVITRKWDCPWVVDIHIKQGSGLCYYKGYSNISEWNICADASRQCV